MRVALLQFAPRFGAIDANLTAIAAACQGRQADLVVLPELCTTGYQFREPAEVDALAEPEDGPALRRLAEIAAQVRGHLVAGFAERAPGGPFNSAALVGPGGVVGLYRKVHLFADERRLFAPGDRGFPVFSAGGVRLGMMICFDWLFPEAARSLALRGAQIIAHPANLVLPYCQAAMVTRALENRLFALTANRTGSEERIPGRRLAFTGQSRAISPDGRVLAEGKAPSNSEQAPEWIEVEIDPAQALDKRLTETNDALLDRRPDQYALR